MTWRSRAWPSPSSLFQSFHELLLALLQNNPSDSHLLIKTDPYPILDPINFFNILLDCVIPRGQEPEYPFSWAIITYYLFNSSIISRPQPSDTSTPISPRNFPAPLLLNANLKSAFMKMRILIIPDLQALGSIKLLPS